MQTPEQTSLFNLNLKNPRVDNEQGFFEFDVTKGGFEMTIDCWITEVAEEINDEEVNPDSKLYSKVFSKNIVRLCLEIPVL